MPSPREAFVRMAILAMTAIVAGCGGSAGGGPSAAPPTSGATAAASPTATLGRTPTPGPTYPSPITAMTPEIDGKFAVTKDGRKMLLQCWGDGTSTVVLDGGEGAIEQWRNLEVANRIAPVTRLCLFDHLGKGGSDPAPNVARTADDLTTEIRNLLHAAGVDHDLVVVGSSFGGMTMGYFAQRFPKLVAGLVTLDTPAPSAELNIDNFPEGVWNYPGNDEHLQVLYGFENRFAKDPIKVTVPLIVVRASAGQTRPDDHYWLDNNPQAVEVNLVGVHDIYLDQPEAVADQILSLVR